jgi:ubiquinone/menaquinone biosynthesis C-methylase UbiE
MSTAAQIVAIACLPLALVAGCDAAADNSDRPEAARDFPEAIRPVSQITSNSFSTEEARDDRREAEQVMALAGIVPGMSVVDIGAGEGYYTVRLAAEVGENGRVLANDIDEDALRRLGDRVERERLDNVSIVPGDPADPRLPPASFDRIFMVHMYHEVTEPYAFLWHLRPALRAGGQVVVVDIDRPADQHGIAPQLLFCEFAAVGYRLVEFVRKPQISGYYAQFELAGERPAPQDIQPCVTPGNNTGGPAAAAAGPRG